MNFKEIYLLGDGKVAKNCLKITEDFFNTKVVYITSKEKATLDEFFTSIKNALIISANNFYIFKKSCVEQNFIINYHNSLLPKHKGCNAHMWSIWENDKKSGITWHKVDYGIDTGEIILQKEIKITEETTALKLLKKQHTIAINSLKECFNTLKTNNFSYEKNKLQGGGVSQKMRFTK
ncbi:formyltransferase family protein [Campylobacter lari]|uniref:formyltransferase family protein n=1 Tax=Campylobacter lari TaxID=201 RepID=UPI001F0903CC|nr:formyltransferase family protein [Campylobacter lari]MCH3688987.1 formyl transferase [Campylobacter lari]